MLKESTLIEDNFVLLKYNTLSTKFLTMENIPSVTFNDLLSQLGGILNLYAGISLVVILELIDLFLRCFGHTCANNVQELKKKEGQQFEIE